MIRVRFHTSLSLTDKYIEKMIYESFYILPDVSDATITDIQCEISYTPFVGSEISPDRSIISRIVIICETTFDILILSSELILTPSSEKNVIEKDNGKIAKYMKEHGVDPIIISDRMKRQWCATFTLQEYFVDSFLNITDCCQVEKISKSFEQSSGARNNYKFISTVLYEELKKIHVDLPADDQIIDMYKKDGVYEEGEEEDDFDDSITAESLGFV